MPYQPFQNTIATLREVQAEKRAQKALRENWQYNPQMVKLIQETKKQKELDAWRKSTAEMIRAGKIPEEKMDEALILMQDGPEALQMYQSRKQHANTMKLSEDERLTYLQGGLGALQQYKIKQLSAETEQQRKIKLKQIPQLTGYTSERQKLEEQKLVNKKTEQMAKDSKTGFETQLKTLNSRLDKARGKEQIVKTEEGAKTVWLGRDVEEMLRIIPQINAIEEKLGLPLTSYDKELKEFGEGKFDIKSQPGTPEFFKEVEDRAKFSEEAYKIYNNLINRGITK